MPNMKLSELVEAGSPPASFVEEQRRRDELVTSAKSPKKPAKYKPEDYQQKEFTEDFQTHLSQENNQKIQNIPEFTVTLENDDLSFDFLIYEYKVLDFGILCILRDKAFSLNPKSNQKFDLIVDKHNYPVYYVGKPQFLKSFNVNILFFLRDFDRE